MIARSTLALSALAAALVLGTAATADAGGIVYWGSNTRVISTAPPAVTTATPTPVVISSPQTVPVAGQAYREGYEDGYQDGYRDGVRTDVRRTVVTSTYVQPTYTYTAPIVTTVPRVVVYRTPIVRHTYVPIIRRSCVPVIRHYRPHHRLFGHHYRGHSGGMVIRW
jgi:hypothetical protein